MLKLSGKLPNPKIDEIAHEGRQCTLVQIELSSSVAQGLEAKDLANDLEFYDRLTQDVNIHIEVVAEEIPDVLIESLNKLTGYSGKIIVTHHGRASTDRPITIRKDLIDAINSFSSEHGWVWNPIFKKWFPPKKLLMP